jgi:hypothetical protein
MRSSVTIRTEKETIDACSLDKIPGMTYSEIRENVWTIKYDRKFGITEKTVVETLHDVTKRILKL